MLNWIWFSIILIAVAVAIGTDVTSLSRDEYRNGTPFTARFNGTSVIVARNDAERFYNKEANVNDTLGIPVKISGSRISLLLPPTAPEAMISHARAQGDEKILVGSITHRDSESVTILFDKVLLPTTNAMVNDGIIAYAKKAVELAIGLVGIMCLWLGVMKVAEAAGLMQSLAKAISPVMKKLFPDVPHDHPAMGAMIMNIAANVLGLGNAATPLGLKAMEELEKLNTIKGTASNAMCTFLVINTGSVQLIPATVIAIRASAGAAQPADILGIVILVTFFHTSFGVMTVKVLEKLKMFRIRKEELA